MAAIHLEKMSFKDMIDLENKLKKAIDTARMRETETLKQKIDAIIQNAGMTIDQVADLYGFGRGRGVRKGSKVAAKYRNPDNRDETWTGRGRQPRWLVAKLSKGAKLGDFTI